MNGDRVFLYCAACELQLACPVVDLNPYPVVD
jgi:hypothetical protein